MAIRIDCGVDGYESCWVEYREKGWYFKDRNAILNSTSDLTSLEIILSYVENWNLLNADGEEVSFDKDAGVGLFDYLDDHITIPWIIGSWFEARAERAAPPKASSDS